MQNNKEFMELIDNVVSIDVDEQFNNPYIDEDYFELFEKFAKQGQSILNLTISKSKYYNNIVYFQSLIWWFKPEKDGVLLEELTKDPIPFSGESDISPNEGESIPIIFYLTADEKNYYLEIWKK